MSKTVVSRQYSVDGVERARTFEDLKVWKSSHKLALQIYKVSSSFPKDEMYGLTSQIRRAAVSVAANIAEGFSRKSNLSKIQFYNISQSSLNEVKYYLILAQDLGYISSKFSLWIDAEQVGKMLYRLIESIRDHDPKI